MFTKHRFTSYVLGTSLALLALVAVPRQARADYVFPSDLNATYLANLTDLGSIFGATGTKGLPSGASTTFDELIGTVQLNSLRKNGSGPELITSGTLLAGMYGDLKVVKHIRPDGLGGFTTISDITPGTGPLVFDAGDMLYFAPAGRNPVTGTVAAPAGSGGYILISDNKTGYSSNNVGSGANENPSKGLVLGSGGISVKDNGTITGTADNYTPTDTGEIGKALDTSHIVLAAVFEKFSSIAGFLAPSGFPYTSAQILANATADTVFVQVGTTPVTVGKDTNVASRSVEFGYQFVVGGSSKDSFLNTTFTNANTTGSVPLGGTAEIVGTIQSQLNFTQPSDYTQFASSSNDPENYIGAGVPEPASILLLSLGAAGAGVASLRRRLRKARKA